MKPRKLLRSVYTLQYDRRTDAWTLLAGNTVVAVYIHYDIAVHSAARTCRDLAKLGPLAAGRGATHGRASAPTASIRRGGRADHAHVDHQAAPLQHLQVLRAGPRRPRPLVPPLAATAAPDVDRRRSAVGRVVASGLCR